MCIQTAIQNKIAELTNDGEDIAEVLADILRGSEPSVKTHHRIEAARMLTKYGSTRQEGKLIPFNPPDNNTPSPLMGEGWDGGEGNENTPPSSMEEEPAPGESRSWDGAEQDENSSHPVNPVSSRPTLRDLIAYPLARYIRERTDDGETLIRSLRYVMDGGHYDPDPFTGHPRPTVKPHEKLSAAKELMRRAFGEHSPPRRASAAYDPEVELDASDPINSAIAKLVREHTDNGIEAAEVLIRVIEDDPRGSEWMSSHRLSAAKELFHRAYDLNYDAVTWEDYEDYRRASEDDYEAYEIGRARRRAEISAILAEYDEAYASGDEEAMETIEKKYYAYLRAEKGEEEEIEYTEYGPNDPDPTPMYPVRRTIRKQNRRTNPKDGRHTAAADIRAPSITIPLKNKSLPP